MVVNYKKKDTWKKIIKILLFITLILSIIYAGVRIINAPSGIPRGMNVKTKSDYVLMLLECIVGVIVMAVPSIVERRLSIDIPNQMEILFFIFLFCAIFLGEVQNLYYIIPFWDTILHAFSGAMLGAIGFYLVNYFNETIQLKVDLSPFFITLFAFCFALACGALWEIYEYLADGLLGTNMQKFITAEGIVLAGHAAISDTIKDLIVDALSSLTITIIGYNTIKKERNKKTRRNRTLQQK